MGMALEGGEGGELDAVRRREGPKGRRIFYFELVVFTRWLIGTYDLSHNNKMYLGYSAVKYSGFIVSMP